MVEEKYKSLSEKYNDKDLDELLELYEAIWQQKPIPNAYEPSKDHYYDGKADIARSRLGYIHRLVLFQLNMKNKNFEGALNNIKDIEELDHLNILWEDIYRDTLRVMRDEIWKLQT